MSPRKRGRAPAPGWSPDWSWYPRGGPRRPADGIKAKTERGQFGKTWWASKWLGALEQLVDPGRLSRGRSYARSGQVLNLDILPGQVKARVQGSRPAPYQVHIRLAPLDQSEWAKVIDAMASQALFAAKLLAGEMPPNIEEAFAAAGVSLFPAKSGDLETDCSCPDYANPCKHVAAVYYLLGEQFDEDPFLLFRLRGQSREQVIETLRARRVAAADSGPAGPEAVGSTPSTEEADRETAAPLADRLEDFWAIDDALLALRFTAAPAELEAAALKRLGEPGFWPGRPGLLERLAPVYAAARPAARERAVGEDEP
jgi:uncharacterized Zn finger protein